MALRGDQNGDKSIIQSEQTSAIESTHQEDHGPDSRNVRKETSRSPISLWTPNEDQILLKAVSNCAEREDWTLVAQSLPGRTGKQCWHRFHYHLKDKFRIGGWTQEEDAIILQQQAVIGNRWSQIASHLPGRSENSIKNRWHCSLRHRKDAESGDSGTKDADAADSGRRKRRRRSIATASDRDGELGPGAAADTAALPRGATAPSDAATAPREDGGEERAHNEQTARGHRPDNKPRRSSAAARKAAPSARDPGSSSGPATTDGERRGRPAGGGRRRQGGGGQYDSPSSPERHTRHYLLLRGLFRRSPSRARAPEGKAAAAAGAAAGSSFRGGSDRTCTSQSGYSHDSDDDSDFWDGLGPLPLAEADLAMAAGFELDRPMDRAMGPWDSVAGTRWT